MSSWLYILYLCIWSYTNGCIYFSFTWAVMLNFVLVSAKCVFSSKCGVYSLYKHIWKYSTAFCFVPENRATQCTHANPHMKVLHHLAHSLWVPIIYFRVACESFSLKKEHIYVHSHSITIEWHLTYSTPTGVLFVFVFEILYIFYLHWCTYTASF